MFNRSLFRGLAAVTISLALLSAACGGDDDNDADATAEPADATASADAGTATPVPTRASPSRPAPTAVPGDGAAITVANPQAQIQFVPTADEFRAFETTTVNGQTGVSLATLAAAAEVADYTLVTIDGANPATGALGAIRYPVADIASTTIFVIDDRGHISLVSETIPEAEWLTNVTAVVLE